MALPIWFRQVLPPWQCTSRNAAIAQLLGGVNAAQTHYSEDGAEPSGRRLWFLVGRALGAAQALQQASNDEPLDAIAHRTAYYDRRSLERAVMRWFGLRARELRGTTGWEWLLWRFLSGLGKGPRSFWDRKPL